MKSTFDQVSYACSKNTTKAYSTSFSLGIRFLHEDIRRPIYNIYGFVRFADEIVDTFHEFDKDALLQKFIADTHLAIEQKISLNPILNSFQEVVNKYNLNIEHVNTFLRSMEMDLEGKEYNREQFNDYVLGSAEVVGLMCLQVFVNGDHEEYKKLEPYAKSLGAAFQKINFLRDLKDDYAELGRAYFPNIDISEFNEANKKEIENEIQKDFDHAYKGIVQLPSCARLGVYVAYVYYTRLFAKIKQMPCERILEERIRIPNQRKFTLFVGSYVKHRFNILK